MINSPLHAELLQELAIFNKAILALALVTAYTIIQSFLMRRWKVVLSPHSASNLYLSLHALGSVLHTVTTNSGCLLQILGTGNA